MRSSFTHILRALPLCLALLMISCNDHHEAGAIELKEYKDFYARVAYENENGLSVNNILFRIDSFYATRPEVSPAAYFYKLSMKFANQLHRNELQAARRSVDSMFVLIKKHDWDRPSDERYKGALIARGNVMFQLGQFDEAYDCFFKLITMARLHPGSASPHEYDYYLAMTLFRQKDFRHACDHFIDGYRYDLTLTNVAAIHMQEVISNIGLCYERMGMPDSALYYYDSALDYINAHVNALDGPVVASSAQSVIYGNIGGVYLKLGNIDTALSYLSRSYQINIRPHHDNRDALLTHIKIARAYMSQKDLGSAYDALVRIEAELDSIDHDLEPLGEWQRMMWEYYMQKGDEKIAVRYARDLLVTQDSLWSAERRHLRENIGNELNEKERKRTIDVLERQTELNKLEIWVTSIMLVLVLVIVILIYNNYRKSRKNVRQLTVLNNKIDGQRIELERSNKEKDRIMDVVVHDLRSPVGGIAAMAEMMTQDNMTAERQERSMGSIHKAASNALLLINELLEYSNATRSELETQPADMAEIAEEAIKLLQPQAEAKQQTIVTKWDVRAVPVIVNREKIMRVFTNLITNAIKFSATGKTIEVSICSAAGQVQIAVRDEGIGIPGAAQANVFDMFTAMKRRGTAGERSYGLGLSIVRQIVEAHGGRIWLESEEGKGTTFYVELPV